MKTMKSNIAILVEDLGIFAMLAALCLPGVGIAINWFNSQPQQERKAQ
jgi:uncharacterized membrane protein